MESKKKKPAAKPVVRQISRAPNLEGALLVCSGSDVAAYVRYIHAITAYPVILEELDDTHLFINDKAMDLVLRSINLFGEEQAEQPKRKKQRKTQ